MNRYLYNIIAEIQHELRSPANAMLSLSDFALRADDRTSVDEYLSEIRKRGKGLLRLLDAFFEFAEVTEGKIALAEFHEFSLCGLLDRLRRLVEEDRKNSSTLRLGKLPGLEHERLQGDVRKMERCLALPLLFFSSLPWTEHIEINIKFIKSHDKGQFLRIIYLCSLFRFGGNLHELLCIKNGMGVFQTDDIDKSGVLYLALCRGMAEGMGGFFKCGCLDGGMVECIVETPVKPAISKPASCKPGLCVMITGFPPFETTLMERKCRHAGLIPLQADETGTAVELYRNASENSRCVMAVMPWEFITSSCDISTVNEAEKLFSGDVVLVATGVPPLALMKNNKGHGKNIYSIRGNTLDTIEQAISFLSTETRDKPGSLSERGKALHDVVEQRPTMNDVIKPGTKALVVEDDRINQQVALNMLKQLGCSVVVASHGKAAMKAVTRKKFDIVFMDLILPDTDGFTLTGEIKSLQEYRNIPVIALTARRNSHSECLENGMDDFIAKPLDKDTLAQLLVRWQQSRKGSA
jgi:two-component system sensor histidine kinase/response regulator